MIPRQRRFDEPGALIDELVYLARLDRIEGLSIDILGADLRNVRPGGHVGIDEARVRGHDESVLVGEFDPDARS